MECDHLYGWSKKQSHTKKSHQIWLTQEKKLGTQKKKDNMIYVFMYIA